MPRKEAKKQTRLAFAPTVASPSRDGGDDSSDRFARLSYGHPSVASVRTDVSQKSKASGSKKKSSSRSKKETPDLGRESPVAKTYSLFKVQAATQNEEESSDDDIIIPSSQRKRRAVPDLSKMPMSPSASNSKKKTRHISRPANEEAMEETSQPRRRLKRKAESSPVVVLSDSDDSEDPVVSSPVKRRRLPDPDTPQTPRSSEDQDDLDIQEDLRDLQDSVVKKTRTRGRVAESARDKRFRHLEALRRRRLGLPEESEHETASGNDDDESEHDNENGHEDEADASPTHRIEYRNQLDSDVESAIDPNEDLDKYEDDFVLEDDTTELGVPTEEMPFEFTRHAYKQPKEYFRDVVGWMVHNRLDPAFPRDDDMYKVAFMKLEDEVKARAGSQLISSVWNSEFVRALRARPHMELSAFPTDLGHSCDACKRSGHPASSDIRLYGKAYSLSTLEPLNDESSEDSDNSDSSEASGVERDRDGHELPGEEKRFYLGRHCKDKAQLAHTLMHWRYQLNEWVVDYLDRMGQMEDSEILRRSTLSQKRKTRNAIDIIKQMVEAGEIEKLWRDFHIALKAAREKTVCHATKMKLWQWNPN
ncbi:uncharacterized protein N7477_002671 [Penicillium maclennaniae]|uniref:uncharacterized protein n=1 Tax=Penicillium maclennaniae TaxID=1343394 RepID=UPI00253F78D9|nr:uncharacterized protein N7477_002671 [Penicillium maclennaniae]KAJ5677038.1 hypothetical protein N7477_002671 [Penicillium maclennaniae]